MPYDLYWNGPINAYFIYAEKARAEEERHRNEMLDTVWLRGQYTVKALMSIYKLFNPMVGKDAPSYPYPEKPERPQRERTPEEKEERRKIIEKMKKVNQELHPEETGQQG